jgi:hypothetical protein
MANNNDQQTCKEDSMGIDQRVGFMTTSILLSELEAYIKIHTENHKYVGDLHYLKIYERLKTYQASKNGMRQ